MQRRACRANWRQNHSRLTLLRLFSSAPTTTSPLRRVLSSKWAVAASPRQGLFSSSSEQAEEIKPPRRACRVYHVTDGVVPYEEAWLCQQRLLHERLSWQREKPLPSPGHDVLLLLEHPSVYTLGRGSTLDNLKFDPSDPACLHEVRRTERGGEVTWHGPGQLVGYPVVDLNYLKKDLHWYMRQLEEVIIRVLARHNLMGERESDQTGVWVGGAKVAAIGLNATRWITSHGFALNVSPDLAKFEEIVPCGIQGRPVTRLVDLLSPGSLGNGDKTVAAHVVSSQVVEEFADVFGVEVETKSITAATGGLEKELFSVEGDTSLLKRLKEDCMRQLELTRRR